MAICYPDTLLKVSIDDQVIYHSDSGLTTHRAHFKSRGLKGILGFVLSRLLEKVFHNMMEFVNCVIFLSKSTQPTALDKQSRGGGRASPQLLETKITIKE